MRQAQKQQLAKELANNPLLPEIFNELRQSYFEAWRHADTQEDRDRLWVKCQVLDDISSEILDITTGEGLNYE